MERYVWLIVILAILTGGVVLCTMRWDAWFANPDEPVWEGDTIDYHFFTFGEDSLPGWQKTIDGWQDTLSRDTLRFVILGDVHNSMDSAQWEAIAAGHPQLDFYAQVGDFLERSYFYYTQRLYHELKGTVFDSLPLINCPGNHEYYKGVVRTLPPMWKEIFVHPKNGPQRFIGSTYYVDMPKLRFIVLDTNGLQRLSDFTIVHTWLAQVLQEAEDKYKIVIMHHPVFSSGVGRQNTWIYLHFLSILRQADLVFSGHDHNYARRLPFVGTNSAKKFYLNKVNEKDTRICSGRQLYEYLTIIGDTLTMQTILMDSGEVYDEIQIVRYGNEREIIDNGSKMQEIIDLPEKYRSRTNQRKVKRFCTKRDERLGLN